jgi:hypothetical protein
MRFFDYKFLILLGLTLVVYFIYREMEYLRGKIEKLEIVVKSLPTTQSRSPTLSPKTIKLDNGLINTDQWNNQPIQSEPNKSIEVNQPIDTVQPDQNQQVNQVMDKINNILKQNDSDIETNSNDNDVSESSKHLAIYSNDNDQLDSTQNSLLESVEANKSNINFVYEAKMEMANLEENMENIMNSISSDKQVSDAKSKKMNELNNMKVSDIKKLACEKNITLSKKVNGQPKPKNKQELINDILEKINI